MATTGWVTNDPEVAAALKAADENYRATLAVADRLPLADKILVIKSARIVRAEAYAEATN